MSKHGESMRQITNSEPSSQQGPICLAFSGAGLHGFYFNGVCQYVHDQEIEVKEAWGASAGALAALSVLMKVGSEAYEAVFNKYHSNYWHLPWMFWHGRDFVWEGEDGGIRRFMPKGAEAEEAWLDSVVNGRLHIVVTKLVGWRVERVVVSHWTSVEDLIGCVRATMTIPGITAAQPFCWRGERWVDGGIMDTHPSTDKAVLVCTSLPFQPWAYSWQRHVDIFRHLPMRLSIWHSHVDGRRDMFKLGYMDAKCFFETEFEEHRRSKPLRPRARAVSFLMAWVLEILQGSFMLALTARFVWRRKSLWHCLLQCRGFRALASMLRPSSTAVKSNVTLRVLLRRLSVLTELTTISAATFLLWFSTIDLRLDLSDHLLDLAAAGKKRFLPSASGSPTSRRPLALKGDVSSSSKAERMYGRRTRSTPCRARFA